MKCTEINLKYFNVDNDVFNPKANTDREWHEAYYTTLMIKRGLK